jgi:hypothetical protein
MSVQTNINLKDDRRWLSQLIAMRALEFFKATSDLLPSEPYIYSSQKGDLVAEFTAVRGTLTSIVSPKFILLFAVVDGSPMEKKVERESGFEELRSELRQLTESLRMGRNGSMATGN